VAEVTARFSISFSWTRSLPSFRLLPGSHRGSMKVRGRGYFQVLKLLLVDKILAIFQAAARITGDSMKVSGRAYCQVLKLLLVDKILASPGCCQDHTGTLLGYVVFTDHR